MPYSEFVSIRIWICIFGYACVTATMWHSPLSAQYSSTTQAVQQPDPRLAFPTAAQLGTNSQLPPAIVTQPTGQRIFAQQDQSAPIAGSPNAATSNSAFRERSQVQPASWNTPTNTIPPNKLKSEPLAFRTPEKDAQIERPRSTWSAALSMIFSLGIVLCLFLMVAWLYRKSQPSTHVKLPKDVVQVLGRTAMSPRQQVFVVRFGNKVLLVSQQPGQTQTLSEIVDPTEVDRIASLCEASQPTSITHSFRDVLQGVVSGNTETSLPRRQKRSSNLVN